MAYDRTDETLADRAETILYWHLDPEVRALIVDLNTRCALYEARLEEARGWLRQGDGASALSALHEALAVR